MYYLDSKNESKRGKREPEKVGRGYDVPAPIASTKTHHLPVFEALEGVGQAEGLKDELLTLEALKSTFKTFWSCMSHTELICVTQPPPQYEQTKVI